MVVSDTTELDYGYQSPRQGLGRLGSEQHRGFFLHSALVVNAREGQVVGLAAQELFTRSANKSERVHRVACRKRPTEAEVWGRVRDRVQPVNSGVKLVHVCDRGADNFDVFAHLAEKGDSWVIRAAQLTRKVRYGDRVAKLSEVLDCACVLGSYQVYVAANGKQKARWAQVEVRAAEITLLRPREGSSAFVIDRNIKEIASNVVEVREVDPPKNGEAIRWVLYTEEPASSFTQALDVIRYYEKRPIIEEYHKGMKTGLRVEQRQYESADHLEPVIGVICVQAARLLQLRDISRRFPSTPAEGLVPSEWLEVMGKICRAPVPSERSVNSCAPWPAWAVSWDESPTASQAG